MKLTVNKIVGTYDTSKTGVPFVTKQGKPYKKATVTFAETGEKLVTVMVWTGQTCELGQVFEGEIAEREWQGKKYYDLKVVTEKDRQADLLAQIKFSLAKHDAQIKEIVAFLKEKFPNQPIRENLTTAGVPVPDFTPQSSTEQAKNAFKMKLYEESLMKEHQIGENETYIGTEEEIASLDMMAEEAINRD